MVGLRSTVGLEHKTIFVQSFKISCTKHTTLIGLHSSSVFQVLSRPWLDNETLHEDCSYCIVTKPHLFGSSKFPLFYCSYCFLVCIQIWSKVEMHCGRMKLTVWITLLMKILIKFSPPPSPTLRSSPPKV